MENKFIVVAYKMYTVEDGVEQLAEETKPGEPFFFVSGFGYNIDSFEKEVVPLAAGEKFDFRIPSEEAYGDYDPEAMVEIDKSDFNRDGHFDKEMVQPGAIVPLVSEDGQRFLGIVAEITADKVIIDLNPPMAGKDLIFRGEILENRPATNKEIEAFINRQCGGCGGSCDGCGGGCGSC